MSSTSSGPPPAPTAHQPGLGTPSVARELLHALVTVVVLVVAVVVIGLVAYLTVGTTGIFSLFYVVRPLVGGAAVVLLVRWRAGTARARGMAVLPWVGAPAVLAYALSPTAWAGATLLAQAFLRPSAEVDAVTFSLVVVADGVLWVALVALGLLWERRRRRRGDGDAPLTPYG